MTAAVPPARRATSPSAFEEADRPRLRAPEEGWSSLVFLIVMMLTVAWAIDDASWAGIGVNGESQTAFLVPAAVIGVLAGLVLAKLPIRPLFAHLASAASGVAFLFVSVSAAISSDPSLFGRLRDLNRSTATFYHDLTVLGIRSAETSVFLLTLGAVVWATAYFAAYGVFRRQRPVSGILVAGLILLVNVSVTIRLQYLHLIVFVGAAMLLLVRMNLMHQREGWRRRRIGDAGYVSGLFLRSGLIFVAFTLIGSIALAATASSAPLAGAWRNVDDQILQIGVELNRWVGGVTGAARGPSGLFTSSQTIRGVWESSTEIVFRVATSDGEGYYWRGATYDNFDGATWQQLDREALVVPAGGQLLESTTETPLGPERKREVTLTVTPVDVGGGVVLAPADPVIADRATEITTNEAGGPLVSLELVDGLADGESYTLVSQVPQVAEEEGGVTANELAAAGVEYPAWTERFVEIRPNSIGDLTYETAEMIVDRLPESRRDPYSIAQATQNYLYSSGGFQYRTDVRGLCGAERLVDCFLRTKRGYCEYFATAMVMLLRTQQIPARLAMGYLPGRQLASGQYEVDRSAAHAWVEVYFPEYGWVRFDPTPGNRENGQTPTRLDPGAPVATPTPVGGGNARPSPRFGSIDPEERDIGIDEPGGSFEPGAVPGTPGGGSAGGSGLPIAVIAMLLLVAVVLVALARARRLPAPEPDLAYRSVARLAGRFGYGPRPTQTAYEYASSLGEVVPAVKGELHVVARAKVEATYGGRQPEGDALAALRAAYQRVRIGLLRLALRRPRWRRRSPRPRSG